MRRLSTHRGQRKNEGLKSISLITENAAFSPTLSQFPELSADINFPPNAALNDLREVISDRIQGGIDEGLKKLKQSNILGSIRLLRVCTNNTISRIVYSFSLFVLASHIFHWRMSAQIKLKPIKSRLFSKGSAQSSSRKTSACSNLVNKWQQDLKRHAICLKRKKKASLLRNMQEKVDYQLRPLFCFGILA